MRKDLKDCPEFLSRRGNSKGQSKKLHQSHFEQEAADIKQTPSELKRIKETMGIQIET
jgi:hypothetical protein